jgi:hypothetical protein
MYQIVRVQKIKSTGIGLAQRHNLRQYTDKHPAPKNINTELSKNNYSMFKCPTRKFADIIKNRVQAVQDQQKRQIRKDCPRALEYMITASPEFFLGSDDDNQKKYFENALEFIKKRHGEENLVSAEIHLDEETPHLHVIVVPIRQLEDGKIKLDPKSFCTPKELRDLQTNFNKQVAKRFGLERGEYESEAKHQTTEQHNKKLCRENRELEKQKNEIKSDIETLEQRHEEVAALAETEFVMPNVDVPEPGLLESKKSYAERVKKAYEPVDLMLKVAEGKVKELDEKDQKIIELQSEKNALEVEKENTADRHKTVIDRLTRENKALWKFVKGVKGALGLGGERISDIMTDFAEWLMLNNSKIKKLHEHEEEREIEKTREVSRGR